MHDRDRSQANICYGRVSTLADNLNAFHTDVILTLFCYSFYDIPSQNNVFTAVDLLNNVSTTPPTKEGKNAAPKSQTTLSFQLSLAICIVLSIAVMTI